MEHVYSVQLDEAIKSRTHHLYPTVSCLSNRNILAFSSNLDLCNDKEKLLSNFVYVVDLNIPHLPYRVTTHKEAVTLVKWDSKGNKLLIGDEFGNIQTWSMVDFMINKWEQTHSVCFSAERIVAGVWFHQGTKLRINNDKKDLDVSYTEKYISSQFAESVSQFGGKPLDGYLCINLSGLVYAQLITSDGEYLNVVDFLSSSRMRIHHLDIACMSDGTFMVVSSNGSTDQPLSCYKIKVSCDTNGKPKLNLACQPFTGLTLHDDPLYRKISQLQFAVKEDPSDLIVVSEGKQGSKIELWALEKKTMPVPASIVALLRQQSTQSEDKEMIEETYETLAWKRSANLCSPAHVHALGVSFSSLFDSTPSLSYVIVAYDDDSLKCLHRQDLQVSATISIKNTGTAITRIGSIHLTWSSCAMVVVDNFAQLNLFRLSPLTESCNSMSMNYAQSMLEYSLISGHDYWDILIGIKPSFVDKLCDRITDTFVAKQSNPNAQLKWLDNVLQLKAALYRVVSISTSNACKSGDFHTLRMLNAVSETIKRLIRPSRECQESVSEKLSVLIAKKPTDTLMSELIPKLEPKDYFIEQPVHQSFQNLLQWVCDLSLYLLSSLSHQLHNGQLMRIPGTGLLADMKALNLLRELLVIIYFWKASNSSCLPHFNKMHENLDVVALLFKLLSKLVVSAENKLDESLLDECSVLPSQVLIQQMDLCPKSIGVASPALHTMSLPLLIVYGNKPPFFSFTTKVKMIDGSVSCIGKRKMDIVRYTCLGVVDETTPNIRCCTRCNSLSYIKSPMRLPAARAWDQQWTRKCICGGPWRVYAPPLNY